MSGDLFEALWVYATFGCWHERTDDFVWKWDCKLKISRWPLFLSEINNSHTYLEITLNNFLLSIWIISETDRVTVLKIFVIACLITANFIC